MLTFINKARHKAQKLAVSVMLAVTLGLGVSVFDGGTALAQQQGNVPGGVQGNLSAPDAGWGPIRSGMAGQVTIPDQKAAVLVQSNGENWRNFKNGPLSIYGAWGIGGIFVILVLFFLLRGRITIDHGRDPQGHTILRFNALERAVHWLTASSFIVLALTGLNLVYGRYIIQPIIGGELFAAMTYYGKLGHNYIAFAFMIGVALMFVLWVRNNIPEKRDIKWLAAGGGLFVKDRHPEAGRFNAGQKLIFWSVMVGGLSLSLTGIAMLWPYEFTPWGGTFAFINNFGFDFRETLTVLEEVQLSVLWHTIISFVMIIIVVAHIYIGSVGMEGAFDAVSDGEVDLNWAKEHHSLWVEETMQSADPETQAGARQPAE